MDELLSKLFSIFSLLFFVQVSSCDYFLYTKNPHNLSILMGGEVLRVKGFGGANAQSCNISEKGFNPAGIAIIFCDMS